MSGINITKQDEESGVTREKVMRAWKRAEFDGDMVSFDAYTSLAVGAVAMRSMGMVDFKAEGVSDGRLRFRRI